MKIYFVRSYTGSYLYTKELAEIGEILVTWGPKNEASIYRSQKEAQKAGEFAFNMVSNWVDDATEHFGIVEIGTTAALEVLRDLFEVRDLGDYIYDIREREGKGWGGPLVLKWGDAVDRAKKLIQEGVE